MPGDATLETRLVAMREHKQAVQAKIDGLQAMMETVDHKLAYYEQAVAAGTELVHRQPGDRAG